MDAASFQQIERLFHTARTLDPPRRRSFLDEETGDAPQVRSAVEALLSADEAGKSADVLERFLSPSPPPAMLFSGPIAGQVIGDYRLIRELGRGGSGVVIEAEQASPRRRVALKLLHFGPPADALQERELLHEAAVLARLNHPSIASVHSAGYTPAGQPYLVMELVSGQRLDRYVRRHPRAARLALFLKICDGIQYAHERGVIHRDLKPSNVLIIGGEAGEPRAGARVPDPFVKILDFGLAKLIERDAARATLSMRGTGWGTLEYMSPEQRRGQPVDERTDVFALGVILFELMTDELPHATRGVSLPEKWHRLEHEPPRRPTSFDPTLRGDLEAIILGATAEEPTGRYRRVADLSADIRRYLTDRPITRRPPGRFYELRKFVRRNRTAAALVLAAFLALVSITAIVYAAYARAAGMMHQSHSQEQARSRLVMRVVLEQDRVRDAEAAGQLRVWQDNYTEDLEDIIQRAEALRNLGPPEEMSTILAEIVRIAEGSLPPGHWYTAALQGVHGKGLMYLGRFWGAERHLRASYEGLKGAVGKDHALTRMALRQLTSLYYEWEKYELAQEYAGLLSRSGAVEPETQPAENGTP